MFFSFLTCSTCFIRMTSAMARIFIAQNVSASLSRHKHTRPKVPVPVDLNKLIYYYAFVYSYSSFILYQSRSSKLESALRYKNTQICLFIRFRRNTFQVSLDFAHASITQRIALRRRDGYTVHSRSPTHDVGSKMSVKPQTIFCD